MDLQWKRDMRQGVVTCLCEVGLGCGAFPWIGGAQREKQMVFGLEGLEGRNVFIYVQINAQKFRLHFSFILETMSYHSLLLQKTSDSILQMT